MAIPLLQNNARGLNLGLAVIAFAGLGGALWLQHGMGQDPCPLCILQRYVWLKLGVFFAIAACFPRSRKVFGWMLGFATITGLFGVAVAVRQWWVLNYPSATQCGRDAVEAFVNDLPMAHWLPSVFESRGFCTDVFPPMLGLSLPTWSLLGLLAYTLIAALLWWGAMPRQRSRFA